MGSLCCPTPSGRRRWRIVAFLLIRIPGNEQVEVTSVAFELQEVHRNTAVEEQESNSVHPGHVGTGTLRLGAEATAARKAVDRSSISRSRSGNSRVFSTAAVYHRARPTGQRFL
jgi:hypothetical protein